MTYPNPPRSRWSLVARWVRGAGYALAMFAGFFQLHAVSAAVREQAGGGWGYVWAGMIAVGGGAATYGAVRDHWTGELLGLPPLGFACMIYSLSLFLSAHGRDSAVASGLLLMGVAMWIIARLMLVLEEMRLAQLEHELGSHGDR